MCILIRSIGIEASKSKYLVYSSIEGVDSYLQAVMHEEQRKARPHSNSGVATTRRTL